MKTHKKKAFTLTELLVVVIVIGILSAAVLPKFSKVIETRKTTEAEEMMAAVRTEQEKRCALDQKYQTDIVKLAEVIPQEESKNFSYSLTTTGMEAQSKGKYGYTLKMPSYADGRLCCESEAECAKLNKDYPLCSDLIARADYQNGLACEGDPLYIECVGEATQACGCQNAGIKTRTCDTSTGTWSDWGGCSVGACKTCSGSDWTRCGCDGAGIAYGTCNPLTGEWEWGNCDVGDCKECNPATQPPYQKSCGSCGTQYFDVQCDKINGNWYISWSSDCEDPCANPYEGSWVTKNVLVECSTSGTTTAKVCSSTPTYQSWTASWQKISPVLSGTGDPEGYMAETFERCESQVGCNRGAGVWNKITKSSSATGDGWASCSGTRVSTSCNSSNPECTKEGYICVNGYIGASTCSRVEQYPCDYNCNTQYNYKTIFAPTVISAKVWYCRKK